MDATLSALGLTPFFTAQLSADEVDAAPLARIIQVQRSQLHANDGSEDLAIEVTPDWQQLPPEQRPTVGDWVVLDEARQRVVRVLERKSVFRRVAAGTLAQFQLIAANVDTLFIVTSCNDDFNESRLERYLAMARQAGVDPVIVITRADVADDPQAFADRVRALSAHLPVEVVNALAAEDMAGLLAWVAPGSTVALVGSSGVGKSTLLNTLAGQTVANTAGIRERDARGRHTTTSRALHRLPGGALLLDVPGMRELKLAQLDEALAEVFDDIEALARRCRFRDCEHGDEPGCAVAHAIDEGTLDARRLHNFRKLRREDYRHQASLAETRGRERQFGKMIRQNLELKAQVGKKHGKDD